MIKVHRYSDKDTRKAVGTRSSNGYTVTTNSVPNDMGSKAGEMHVKTSMKLILVSVGRSNTDPNIVGLSSNHSYLNRSVCLSGQRFQSESREENQCKIYKMD